MEDDFHTTLKPYYFIYRLYMHNTLPYTQVGWLMKQKYPSFRFAPEVSVIFEWNEGMTTVYNLYMRSRCCHHMPASQNIWKYSLGHWVYFFYFHSAA